MYAALDPFGSFIETFGQLNAPPNSNLRSITSGELGIRSLSELKPRRPIRLVNLTGPNLARLGLDSRIFAANHHPAQQWSRAFYEHPDQPDGILYHARHDPDRYSIAAFEGRVDWIELNRAAWLSKGVLLRDVLNQYGFALIETHTSQYHLTVPKKPGKQGRLF